MQSAPIETRDAYRVGEELDGPRFLFMARIFPRSTVCLRPWLVDSLPPYAQALEGLQVYVPAKPGLPRMGRRVELVKEWGDNDVVVVVFGRHFG